jgi:rubrerythrin
MGTDMHAGPVTTLTPEELRAFVRQQSEKNYYLVDVRQPAEYEQRHIPGAVLLPLTEIEEQRSVLESMRGRNIVFYCRTGTRSARAAAFATQVLKLPSVYQLSGGFMAYSGHSVAKMPNLQAIDVTQGVDQIILQALELEKGAERLYEKAAERFASTPVGTLAAELAKDEVSHGRALFAALARLAGSVPEPFEQLFERLEGNLLENGEPIDAFFARAEELGAFGIEAMLELALELELTAYELYKHLSLATDDAKARAILLDLADQEQRHIRKVTHYINMASAQHPPRRTRSSANLPQVE